jgi:hypothetical protein
MQPPTPALHRLADETTESYSPASRLQAAFPARAVTLLWLSALDGDDLQRR